MTRKTKRSNDISSSELLREINNVNSNIQFTLEQPNERNEIAFLDYFLQLHNNQFKYHLFFKATHSGCIMSYASNLSTNIKRGIIIGEIRRAVNRSSGRSETLYSLRLVLQRLYNNDYPLQIMHSCLCHFLKPKICHSRPENIMYIKVPFVNDFF